MSNNIIPGLLLLLLGIIAVVAAIDIGIQNKIPSWEIASLTLFAVLFNY